MTGTEILQLLVVGTALGLLAGITVPDGARIRLLLFPAVGAASALVGAGLATVALGSGLAAEHLLLATVLCLLLLGGFTLYRRSLHLPR